jgi:aspartate aminotransferase
VQVALGALAVRHGFAVISDEIYEHLTYAPARFRSFGALAPEARDLTIVVNGVSKAYAMTGWRIGWAVGPFEVVRRMVRLQSHSLTGPPDFCQRAAHAALTGPQDDVERMRDEFAARAKAMHAWIAKIPDVECGIPAGAFYLLPDVSAYLGRRHEGRTIGDAETLAALLLDQARAAVVPGTVFEAPFALRFSYACSRDDIERGMSRVRDCLASLRQ